MLSGIEIEEVRIEWIYLSLASFTQKEWNPDPLPTLRKKVNHEQVQEQWTLGGSSMQWHFINRYHFLLICMLFLEYHLSTRERVRAKHLKHNCELTDEKDLWLVMLPNGSRLGRIVIVLNEVRLVLLARTGLAWVFGSHPEMKAMVRRANYVSKWKERLPMDGWMSKISNESPALGLLERRYPWPVHDWSQCPIHFYQCKDPINTTKTGVRPLFVHTQARKLLIAETRGMNWMYKKKWL
jgi:hypothetical protein